MIETTSGATGEQASPSEAGTNRGPQIFGLSVYGDPFDRRSWSGSAWSFFSALRAHGVLVDARSADLTFPQMVLSAVRNFRPSRRAIYLNLMKSSLSFHLRSMNARRLIAGTRESFSVILQIGAQFQVEPPPGVLYCSFHDGNTAVSRRPEFSFMKAASPRVMRESWECEQAFYRRVDLVFTMSEWLRSSMIQDFGVPESRVVTVGAGPNMSYWRELLKAPHSPTLPRKKALLFMATNFEFKGGPALLQAFQRIHAVLPEAELWIVGCTPNVDVPGVEVIGVLDKNKPEEELRLRKLLDTASVFVLPTLYDCFPISLIEAMYHRLPCVVTNVCSLPEMIQNGETGFLVPVGDAVQLAERVIGLLRDEKQAQEMGERALRHATGRFTWDLVVRRMLNAISDAAPQGVVS